MSITYEPFAAIYQRAAQRHHGEKQVEQLLPQPINNQSLAKN